MADADLTLDRLQEVIEKLENLRLVGDVQSYLRLGEESERGVEAARIRNRELLIHPDRFLLLSHSFQVRRHRHTRPGF